MRRCALLLWLAACHDGARPHVQPPGDAAPVPPPDAAVYPACREFDSLAVAVPAHVMGSVAGADVQSPTTCAIIDAPYGVESAGPDSVVRIDHLSVGVSYFVRLASASDSAFYVVSGCSTPTGPSAGECLRFEDASSGGDEVGQFVASATSEYVVVDYYATTPPPDPTFTLDVYREQCQDNSTCSGATPACVDGRCVQCATSFDCADPGQPRCDDQAHTCQAGFDACTSDDDGEPNDDGPAGATVVVPDGSGHATRSGQICASPLSQADFIAFDVATPGEAWDLALSWNGAADLDLEVFDAAGSPLGLSYYEHPEQIALTYLPAGRYYARISEFAAVLDATPVPYTLTADRTIGPGCTGAADCATTYRNQIYRGQCAGGACVSIAGSGAVAEGGACDSQSDCASGLSCPSFLFVANASTRDVCAPACASDLDCAGLGAYVCTTYLQDNFCVQRCTSDSECPTAIGVQPVSGPWFRLACDVTSGQCVL